MLTLFASNATKKGENTEELARKIETEGLEIHQIAVSQLLVVFEKQS